MEDGFSFRMEDLIRHVGPEIFDSACAHAWSNAISEDLPEVVAMVPHQLESLWLHLDKPSESLQAGLELYRIMPTYATLMYLQQLWDDLGLGDRAKLLANFRDFLNSSEQLATHVEYSLWCDYFEDENRVREVWAGITAGADLRSNGSARIARASGPVPWKLKAQWLSALADLPEHHAAVFEALIGAAFDVYGEVEQAEALRILARLKVDTSDQRFVQLCERLQATSR